MSGYSRIWFRRIILFFAFVTAFAMLTAFQAVASIDIRDIGNSDSVGIEMIKERTQNRFGTPGSYKSPGNTPPENTQRSSSQVVNHSRTGGERNRSIIPDDGIVTLHGCLYGTTTCDINVLADRTPEADVLTEVVPAVEPAPAPEPVEIVITTSDLMELIPSTPQIVMDRGPFGLKNAHTNFYASDHQAQTVTETMFGQEVTIVATPIEYRWDYGDGNTLTTQTPGRPVETFNVETETSHQYTEPGTYTVILTTVFEGTYQVDGGPTQAVSSTVTQQADPVEIEIWRAVTRNVDQTCGQNPQAWGC